jgi:hypothetical protein
VRWLAIAVSLLTLVFVGAGCGGGSDEASSDTDTVVATDTIGSEDTTTDETSTDDTSTEGTETDTSGTDTTGAFNFASEDCQNLVKAFVGLSAAIGAASSGQDVSGDVEKFAQYADEVPDEIKEDVQTISTAYGAFLDKLKDIGYTPGQVPTADQIQQLQAASDSVGTPEVQAASDRLGAWTTENCKK